MQSISNNGIMTFHAGDSIFALLFLNQGNNIEHKRYILTEDDKIFFSIMLPHSDFNCGMIRKIYTIADLNNDGDVLITLSTDETEKLRPGTYYYEIKFQTIRNNTEYVETVVPKRKVVVL